MRLTPPLLTRHVFHWSEEDGPALPSAVRRFIRHITANGSELSEAVFHPDWFDMRAAQDTRLELEEINGAEALVAYAQRPTNATSYLTHLRQLRYIPTSIPGRIGANERYDSRVPMGLTDEEREQLAHLAAGRFSADAEGGIFYAWDRAPSYQVLQVPPAHDPELFSNLRSDTLVLFTDPAESQRVSGRHSVQFGDDGTRVTELVRNVLANRALVIGPLHFTDEALPAGEAYGSAQVDARWFELGSSDMHRHAYDAFNGSILRMRSDHDHVLPYSLQVGTIGYLPVDWRDEQRLNDTIRAYHGRQHEEHHHTSRKATEWVQARFASMRGELRLRSLSRWLVSRRRNALQTIERQISTASDMVGRRQRELVSALRDLETAQQQLQIAQLLPDEVDPGELQGLDRLMERGIITSFTPGDSSDQFSFTTRELYAYDPRSQLWHRLGAFQVTVNMGGGHNSTMVISNISGLQRNGHSSSMHHPHVFRNGLPCVGSFVDVQTDLLINRDWRTLIDVTLAFLESVNVDDVAGQYITAWPLASDEMQDQLNNTHSPTGTFGDG